MPHDYGEARAWCKKASQNGEKNAFIVPGRMAEQGLGGARDPGEAETWYQDAAIVNVPEGFIELARLKSQSSSHDDRKEAYFWLYVAQLKMIKQTDALIRESATHLTRKEMEKEEKKAESGTSCRNGKR